MGSRGTFDETMGKTGGIPISQREYSEIGKIGRIKIIQCDTKDNNPTPTYSNTANTTYYSFHRKSGRIEHIYYYRNHRLVKSVDFKQGEIPHIHYWNSTVVGRKKHDLHNTHAPNDRDNRLITNAIKWNKEHGS